MILGTRVHGCIVSLQARTPSILTTIDSRTEGLAEMLAISRVKTEDLRRLPGGLTPQSLVDFAGLDFASYHVCRKYLYLQYQNILREFGATLTPSSSNNKL